MEQLGLQREDEYYDRLRGEVARIVEAELRNLLNLVTVTETCFFRDAPQFDLLREHIIPTLMAERSAAPTKRLRIWSAGCSSGEEAYSIALTLDDMGVFRACPDWAIEIVGTDLNTKALEKARRGVYSARAVRNVEGRLLDQYFRRDGKTFHLNDAIKRRVTFEFGNLKQTAMPTNGPQDLVVCKNVSIYFRSDVTRTLMRGLHETLAPGGYLLLGHAETLWQMSEGFALMEHDRAFCYRKISAAPPTAIVVPAAIVVPTFRSASPKPNTTAHYDLCLSAFRKGEWHVAEKGLAAVIDSCPTFVPAHLLLGGVYAHCGRYDEAVTKAELVLTLTDLEPRAHLLLGMVAARRQRYDEALQSLRRALYLDDSLALAHFWLGNLYRDRGDIARACLEYENVVRDWERHTLELTEEFASDFTAEQLVAFCSDSLQRLRSSGSSVGV